MNNRQFLELAPKIDNRYLELMGKPYEISHKKGKTTETPKRRDVFNRLRKEFGITNWTINSYLRVFHIQPEFLRDIESGRSWTYYSKALESPMQKLIFQKIKNNEFTSKEEIKAYIKQHKDIKIKEESMKTSNKPSVDVSPVLPVESFSEHIRNIFRTQGVMDINDVAQKRVGKPPSEQEKATVLSSVYNVKKSIEKELGKNMVREGNIFRMENIMEKIPGVGRKTEDPKNFELSEVKTKTKTAVLVVREVRDGQNARYELDIVGDFNRGMMKEALKQLMEVFI